MSIFNLFSKSDYKYRTLFGIHYSISQKGTSLAMITVHIDIDNINGKGYAMRKWVHDLRNNIEKSTVYNFTNKSWDNVTHEMVINDKYSDYNYTNNANKVADVLKHIGLMI
jgi:hypothetical protein